MADYAQILDSAGVTGFYPVTDGIDCDGARMLLSGDANPGRAGHILAALPDPGAGFEWYEKDCSGSAGVVTSEDNNFDSPAPPPGSNTNNDDLSSETGPDYFTA